MLPPHVVESGWRSAGLHPFNVRTILEHSCAFPELSEDEQARIEAKVKELAGDSRNNGDLEPEAERKRRRQGGRGGEDDGVSREEEA